ncbi:aldo/keto reductase [Ramlibacter sp.]|uniref:aldo/keto reductase n=1 Tax=Ramlibacter sp. TaxID=1917967 RepID=UPI002628B312|nr:aldo/keto reductase [Ramlibacter sp.]MDB5958305.1 aldo/keto reductase [Ramlibacter sp.]
MKRRTLLRWSFLAAAAPAVAQPSPFTRAIPSTGEPIPRVGLGTWITFNVGQDPPARARCAQVMEAFFDGGGRLIDSSPMYGSSQGVVGEGVHRLGARRVFAADKVWTGGDGAAQIEKSRAQWQITRFDLLQVHNLLAWEKQLPVLLQMKQRGQVRYVGITTSEGRRHAEFERIMRTQRLDFVQFTYNLVDREVEERLLPLAAERGLAVLINRPFQEGDLLRKLQRHPLPAWAPEIECGSWAQFALKFVISHPAVTCAIPATRRVEHVRENLGVARSRMPDEAMRRRMAAYVSGL